MSVTISPSATPAPQTADWDATLARLDAEQGFTEPAAVEGQPAPTETPDVAAVAPADAPAVEAQAPTTDPTPAPEESEVTKLRRELEAVRGNVQNAAKQAAEQVRQQMLAEQAANQEKDRLAERARIQAQINARQDPTEKQDYQDYYDRLWQQEDAAKLRTENESLRQQATQVTAYMQTNQVVQAIPELLPRYAEEMLVPQLAARGIAATADEVRAIVAQPEIIGQAQQIAWQGPQAMNMFGELLTTMVSQNLAAHRQQREQTASANRAARDGAGVGRGAQPGASGAPPAIDLNQFKSTKDGRSGDWNKMLEALNQQQGIR